MLRPAPVTAILKSLLQCVESAFHRAGDAH
jgi:hypothetical protein